MSAEPETSSVSRYEITASSKLGGPGLAQANGQSIPFSTTGPEGGAGPAELLAASLAACLLKNVERMSSLLPFQASSAQVKVTLEREDRPPRFVKASYHLTLDTAEPLRRLALLHKNLTKFGTVYGTLSAALTIEGQLSAKRPDGSIEDAPPRLTEAKGA